MKRVVTHINLLERRTPVLTVGAMLGGVLLLTAAGLFLYGRQVLPASWEAQRRSAELAQQVKDAQGRLAAASGEQQRNARAVMLRKEIETLQPKAEAAQALVSAVRAAEGGRGVDVSRVLEAATGVTEPGLWLTAVTVANSGKEMAVQGQSGGAPSVLRFARRVNEALKPMAVRMDSLEVQPPQNTSGQAPGGTSAGTLSFRLY